jgi:FkbM family methyltransferase
VIANFRYYLRRLLFIFRRIGIRNNDTWARLALICRHEFPKEVRETDQGLAFPKLDISILRGEFIFVLDQYQRLKTVKERLHATFIIKDGLFLICFNNITLNPTSSEEIFILEEIFVRGIYNYVGNSELNVIDIGMNVGFASLFFASDKRVSKVYAFEPFTPTFNQALVNFGHNKFISHKIVPHNFGLGAEDKQLVVGYDYENKGQVGIYGTRLVRSSIMEKSDQVITIQSVSKALGMLFEQHSDEAFLIKMDCEGAEYSIIESMASGDLLSLVTVIIIEWHEKGPEPLLEKLRQFGFSAFSQREPHKEIGMIYAFK